MQPLQRPANRLTVGHQQIEVVQPISMRSIEHASHHAMNRQRRGGQRAALLCRRHDPLDRGGVVDRIDPNAEHVEFAVIDHRATVSSQR